MSIRERNELYRFRNSANVEDIDHIPGSAQGDVYFCHFTHLRDNNEMQNSVVPCISGGPR